MKRGTGGPGDRGSRRASEKNVAGDSGGARAGEARVPVP
jgi:hypothetical protein